MLASFEPGNGTAGSLAKLERRGELPMCQRAAKNKSNRQGRQGRQGEGKNYDSQSFFDAVPS
jgi:hypothetical protein